MGGSDLRGFSLEDQSQKNGLDSCESKKLGFIDD